MTKQEYNDYIEALKGRGYKFGDSWYNNSYYSKVIEYREDEDGNRRPVCVIFFNLCETKDERSGYVYYSIEPIVTVSRNTDELLNFGISKPERTIEEYEHLAKEFLRWVDMNIDIWRNEYFNINQNKKENGK